MQIRINRNRTEPPPRDYSSRDTPETRKERREALLALASLEPGQSIEFTGDDISRDRTNSLIAVLRSRGIKYKFATAKIPGGVGVWRI